MMCPSFVRRGDPEERRFAKRHGKKIDPQGKLCRYRADQARTAGSLVVANAFEYLRREPGWDGDGREALLPDQCPSLLRSPIYVLLNPRLADCTRPLTHS